jgi:RecA-family ATPase
MTSIKTITEFVYQESTPKEIILAPWLKTGELVMVYAPTGVGKSMLAIGLAHCIATGQCYLGWIASKLWSVCYIEAEMSTETAKSRLSAQEAGSCISAAPENFTIVSRDPKDNHLPNIGTPEGQRELLPILLKHDVIVLDNLTSAALPVSGRDDDVRIWYRMKPFLFHLRNLNKTVVIIHHSGKSGDQLCT